MQSFFTFDELEAIKQSIPDRTEFPIEFRSGEDRLFSVDKGLIDWDVVALTAALQQKLLSVRGILRDPLTNYEGTELNADGKPKEQHDSLFRAIKWVWYDDKNGLNYKLYFDRMKLTFLGEQLMRSLIKEDFSMNLGIGDEDDPSGVWGGIGEFS